MQTEWYKNDIRCFWIYRGFQSVNLFYRAVSDTLQKWSDNRDCYKPKTFSTLPAIDFTRAFITFKTLYRIVTLQKLTYIFSSWRRDIHFFSLFQHSFFLQPVALGSRALSLLNPIIHADCRLQLSDSRIFFFIPIYVPFLSPFLFVQFFSIPGRKFLFSECAII